jgi:predicted ester cyclase
VTKETTKSTPDQAASEDWFRNKYRKGRSINMSNTEKAKALYEALARGDGETSASYMSDDFIVIGPTPQPLSRREFIEVHKMLAAAVPDFSFNTSDAQEEGDKVTLTIQITGTHTGVLDLGRIGLPVPPVQPTGRKIAHPVEHPVVTFRNGKVSALDLPQVAGGGLPGLLEEIGVELPAPTGTHS